MLQTTSGALIISFHILSRRLFSRLSPIADQLGLQKARPTRLAPLDASTQHKPLVAAGWCRLPAELEREAAQTVCLSMAWGVGG